MKVNYEIIYEHIGSLLYSIACEHKPLTMEGYGDLLILVEQLWKPQANEAEALQLFLKRHIQEGIKKEFHNHVKPDQAFNSFQNSFELDPIPFDKTLQSKLLVIGDQIARAFHETQSSSGALNRLHHLFSDVHFSASSI